MNFSNDDFHQQDWVAFMWHVELRLKLMLIWVWGWSKAELRLRLRLKLKFCCSWLDLGLSWVGFELGLSWVELRLCWVGVVLSWGFVELMLNYSRNLTFIGLGFCSKTFFRSTHIAEHLFSMFPSILTFNFDPIYRLFFFSFLGPNGLFYGMGLC